MVSVRALKSASLSGTYVCAKKTSASCVPIIGRNRKPMERVGLYDISVYISVICDETNKNADSGVGIGQTLATPARTVDSKQNRFQIRLRSPGYSSFCYSYKINQHNKTSVLDTEPRTVVAKDMETVVTISNNCFN